MNLEHERNEIFYIKMDFRKLTTVLPLIDEGVPIGFGFLA